MNHKYRFSVLAWVALGAIVGQAQTYNFDEDAMVDTTGQVTLQPYNLFGSGQFPEPAGGTLSVSDGVFRLEASHLGMGTFDNPAVIGTILGPTRIGAFNPVPYSDFRVAMDIAEHGTGGSVEGRPFYLLGARITDPGPGTTSAYAAQYYPIEEGAAVAVLLLTNEEPTAIYGAGGFGGIRIPEWSADKRYRLVFTGRGPALSVQVFELGEPVKLLFTWNVTDSTYTSGITGILLSAGAVHGAEIGEQSIQGSVDNFVSGPAPELVEAPPLAIATSVMLSWPVPEGPFRLERSYQAGGPWSPYEGTPTEVDGELQLHVKIVENRRFFRLVHAGSD